MNGVDGADIEKVVGLMRLFPEGQVPLQLDLAIGQLHRYLQRNIVLPSLLRNAGIMKFSLMSSSVICCLVRISIITPPTQSCSLEESP